MQHNNSQFNAEMTSVGIKRNDKIRCRSCSESSDDPEEYKNHVNDPYISMRYLNIPNNRISENGISIHPKHLAKYFQMMNLFYYKRNDISLIEGWKKDLLFSF